VIAWLRRESCDGLRLGRCLPRERLSFLYSVDWRLHHSKQKRTDSLHEVLKTRNIQSPTTWGYVSKNVNIRLRIRLTLVAFRGGANEAEH
jgi:hypothetical protein